jgi:hypothetical protein
MADPNKKPLLGKCHSQLAANEFLRLGWTLKREFYEDGITEPCEYLFAWEHETDAVHPNPDPSLWGKPG